jgi:hypothetical protein
MGTAACYNQRYLQVEEYMNPEALDVIEDETGELLMIELSAQNFEEKKSKNTSYLCRCDQSTGFNEKNDGFRKSVSVDCVPR